MIYVRIESGEVVLVSFMAVQTALAQSPDSVPRSEFEAYKTETESRIATLEELKPSADSATRPAVLDFEFHGYFRAGLGVNGDGMEAFQAPNAESKYRLGNEAETYVEATFQQHFRSPELVDNGGDFYTVLTFAYVTPTINNNNFDTTTSLREAYAGARGVWAAQPDALFWAGNRFMNISTYISTTSSFAIWPDSAAGLKMWSWRTE